MELFKYMIKKDIKNIRFLPRAFIGIMYVIGIYDEKRVKEIFLKFIERNRRKAFRN